MKKHMGKHKRSKTATKPRKPTAKRGKATARKAAIRGIGLALKAGRISAKQATALRKGIKARRK